MLNDVNFGDLGNFDIDTIRSACIEQTVKLRSICETPSCVPYDTIWYTNQTKHMETYKSIVKELNNYETITFHKNIAQSQRTVYSKNIEDAELLKGKILIELDFKQKFTIGLSPRQVNSEYYQQIVRTCLGF